MPVRVSTTDSSFLNMVRHRYAGFVGRTENVEYDFEVHLEAPRMAGLDDPLRVFRNSGRWRVERGDFRAEWDPLSRSGSIRQTANPYSLDSVLRIVHTVVLSRQEGFLMHAASAVLGGQAYLFAGVSGAGKTTISRLAPKEAVLLTDEISYVRKQPEGYRAFGTPFTGELGQAGENVSAPLAAVYLLAKGPENRIEPLTPAEAAAAVLSNILFFAEDAELVKLVFRSVLEFVRQVPIRRLKFVPDARVWEMIA